MRCSPLQLACREAVLLFLCFGSDALPNMISSFLASRRAIWTVLMDNASHAGIAAASWAVVVLLSTPSAFLIAMPGSPLYRCIACAFERAHNRPSAKSSPPMPTVEAAPAGGGSHANDSSRVPCRGGTLTACVGARPAAARETFCAACLGSALDLDHFLAAGSLRLSRATGLAERPWGHSLAALVVAAVVVHLLTHHKRAATSVFSAGMSHQLRDATRRGLWLYPPRGPKTPPLGYPTYLLAQALLPLAVALFLRWNFAAALGCCFQGTQRRRQWAGFRAASDTRRRDRDEATPPLLSV